MGVKQKTPTPFVGAGSVRTVTPNLTGPWTAVAKGVDDLLNVRFEDRKNVAIEQGEIDSQGLVTYDENGRLNPITNLPDDNSYYSQSLKQNAKVNYYNALQNDIQNFSNKALTLYPNQPDLIAEQFQIYSDNANQELDPALAGTTNQIIKQYQEETILKSQSNVINKAKKDSIVNASTAIEQIENKVFSNAQKTNSPLWAHEEEIYLESLQILAINGVEGHSLDTIPIKMKDFKSKHKVYKSLYQANNYLKVLTAPTGVSEEDIDLAQLNLYALKEKLLMEFGSSQDDTDLFQSKWQEMITNAEKEYNDKKEIMDRKITKEQSNNMFGYKTDLDKGNTDSLIWLENDREVQNKLANKHLSISQITELSNEYWPTKQKSIEDIEKIKAEIILNGYEMNNVSYEEVASNEYITSNLELFKKFNDLTNDKIKKANDNLKKRKSEQVDLNIQNIELAMPDIIYDENSPFFHGLSDTEITTENIINYIIEKEWVDKESFNDVDYNRSGAIEKLLSKRSEILASKNKEDKIYNAIKKHKNNGTVVPNEILEDLYEYENITFDINVDDPIEFFELYNLENKNLHGPLKDILSDPLGVSQDNAFKMLPLIEKMVIPNTEYNKAFLRDLDSNQIDFWKTYNRALKTLPSEQDAYEFATKKYTALENEPDIRNKPNTMFNNHFGPMPARSINSTLGQDQPAFMGNFQIGLNAIKTAIVPGANINTGMGFAGTDAGRFGIGLDLNNEADQLTYVGMVYNKVGGKSEGIWGWLKSGVYKDSSGQSRLTNKRVRALVNKWGGFGDLTEMNIPLAVKKEALERYKIQFEFDSRPYIRNGENRDKAIFNHIMDVLEERNYSPEVSSTDGVLSTKGNLTKGYTLKWKINSIASAMFDTGWGDVGIRPNPALMGQEISFMMHNPNFNYNPDNEEELLFSPRDFKADSFHNVDWMLQRDGVDDDGNPYYNLYWFDKELGEMKPVKVPEIIDNVRTGQELQVIYPYGYKNSFYKTIRDDQEQKLEKIYQENKWLQKSLISAGYETISQAYLDGFNFFGLSDVTGYSPNFLDTIMEMHLIQNKRNTYYNIRKEHGEGNKPKDFKFNSLKTFDKKIDSQSQTP